MEDRTLLRLISLLIIPLIISIWLCSLFLEENKPIDMKSVHMTLNALFKEIETGNEKIIQAETQGTELFAQKIKEIAEDLINNQNIAQKLLGTIPWFSQYNVKIENNFLV